MKPRADDTLSALLGCVKLRFGSRPLDSVHELMDPNRQQVDKTLSLIAALDLPHPSGALLKSFVTEALHPVVAARYVEHRLSAGDAQSLVSNWIYIVESSKLFARPDRTSLIFPVGSDHTRPSPVATRCCHPGSDREARREQVLYYRKGWHDLGSFARRAYSPHPVWLDCE